MAKIKMQIANDRTFAEGCEEYLLDCKARNLRDGTIKHYVDSIKQIKKYIDEDTPLQRSGLQWAETLLHCKKY